VILDWNRSIYYALAVGHLADRLAGAPALAGPRPALGPALSSAEVHELQRLLAMRGFDPGEPDGRTGPVTRGALRAFQASEGLPADGYPTRQLLVLLRRQAATPMD
jgi:membrane-bound lytic murein transglycosylase B